MEELTGLMDFGCFKIVDMAEADCHRLYLLTFVDKIKPDSAAKSRLFVAACNDTEHGILTGAPTFKRLSIRLLLALGVSFCLKLFARDFIKAFVQFYKTLHLPECMNPPKEIGVSPGKVFQALKPLYDIPESPMHWYTTYVGHHESKSDMQQPPVGPCLMYKRDETQLFGLMALQGDDTLYAGKPESLNRE